jgi:NAD(P)-dependent dehydrogenase (short-subunit alcohol dehydrogenase family)
MRDLADKVIVITGASTGIGAATAIQCAEAGMDCVLNGLRPPMLEAVAQRVRAIGRGAVAIPGCVTEPDMTSRLLDAAEREFGGFDVVFANAGRCCHVEVARMPMGDVRELFDINFFAPLGLLHQAAHRLMRRGRPGHLLANASCMAKFSYPDHGAYAATKSAITQACSSMRAELAPYGIDVSVVCPAVTRTEFFRAINQRKGLPTDGDCIPDYCPRFMVEEPEDVARAVLKCLRRPKPEVWTSFMVRAFAAMVTLWPWPNEFVMRRHVQRGLRRRQKEIETDSLVAEPVETRG